MLTGALFGLGLLLSGMTRPTTVLSFLSLTEGWDPSLGLVMVGAIGVYLPAYRAITRRAAPFTEPRFYLPARRDVDGALIGGAALFGVGWGLAGYCPGPALVSAGSGGAQPLLFVAAMAAGMLLHAAWDHMTNRRATPHSTQG